MQPTEIDQVPDQWKEINVSALEGLLMVVGATDTGKTTFVRYLFDLYSQKYPVAACIDGDPGQSRLGPPATVTLAIRSGEGPLCKKPNVWRRFIGSVSPLDHMLHVLTGSFRLLDKAYEMGANVVIFDTSGWVDAKTGGADLKLLKIDLMRPQTLFILQRNQELESWLVPLRKSLRVPMIDVACISENFRRDFDTRKSYRVDCFKRYFAHANTIDADWTNYAVFPSTNFKPHHLISFEDRDGFTVSLGIILAFNGKLHRVKVYSPISPNDLAAVCSISIGDLAIDPVTFEHRIIPAGPQRSALAFIRKLWGE